ncbi:BgTH12-01773 [Blumeria graminis f. sp. triticale]|uniref:RNA cytidine acetyltransferase n=1 Tax=Blumeria graminis f. sp. triticale TaxID=1689686 RepID=A0A9W4DKJ8_BLUGR|nr:BgTH12-01769 [Blumeria graminis f. sp. triticale]CAD6501519.1 BgTH12-01771 [Blumeria graminis f. sp. triticale]CAD6501521.1 BgTH12-01773 [Blumeria graminis f. sp. triticale]
MVKKAVDSRIPALIRNGIQEKNRSFFVVVGERAKDVIVHLHYIMSSMDMKQNKSVLWAYKHKLLGFTSHRKKRENKIKKEVKRGIREANTEDPFELFVSLHNIRYVYYKETEKILGNTYGMCILQDFEAITPNLLARTIETVEGGGMLILLLKAHDEVVARFNERFILSLGKCESCLVIDDELNVLPISGGKNVVALPPPDLDEAKSESQIELEKTKEEYNDKQPIGSLIAISKTTDQAKALLSFVDAITEKSLRGTVTLTAARGRGKSAALGVAIAAAVSHGYSNIFITSPSPENLKTLFEFIFKGFDALNYLDHEDYSIIQSTNPDFNKAIVRVNIHRQHRQTIQYIRPQDAQVLGQAELLVIDEAAAIPLPLVRKLMGPYLVFMASTINGYEGTGRSLSLKLIKQLRDQSRVVSKPSKSDMVLADRSTGKSAKLHDPNFGGSRTLREVTLHEPIRYSKGDPVERWLNSLLCLDATLPRSSLNTSQGCPDPSQCELLSVNRDTLFSFHEVSEKFLQQIIALYVASHYKNSPDDLQLMSDAPAHRVFVLVPPVREDMKHLPEPLCVIQVALEGKISRESVMNSLSRGKRAAGDLIPWTVSQQFQDDEFAGLSGARIVRIATNPEYINMGYGSKALELLIDFYGDKFTNLSETKIGRGEESIKRITDTELANSSLLTDDIKVRDITTMPPLFSKLSDRLPDRLDYVGVSFGLTQPLHRFWKRAAFAPVYLRQTPNELTGEHTCVMIKPLGTNISWLGSFSRDFELRFLKLLKYQFKEFPSILALSIDESASLGAKFDESDQTRSFSKEDLDRMMSPFDLKRLESYANNMLDYHVILDLVPDLAFAYFNGQLKSNLKLTGIQSSILLAIGLQCKDLTDVEKELSLPSSQLLAMFIKIMRKISSHFAELVSDSHEANMPAREAIGVSRADANAALDDEVIDTQYVALETNLEEELEEGGNEALKELKEKQRELINALPLDQYEIEQGAPGWADAEKQVLKASKSGKKNPVVSIKGKKLKRKVSETAAEIFESEIGEKNLKKSKKLHRN